MIVDFNLMYKEEYIKRRDFLWEIVFWVEIVFLNEREVFMIMGVEDVKDVVRIFYGWGVKLVVIICGEKGVFVYDGLFREFFVFLIKFEEIVDLIGGGDVFVGGFFVGYLRGCLFEECVRLGLERVREVLKKWGDWSIIV